AAGPVLDRFGPMLAGGTAPASPLAATARLLGLAAAAQPGRVVVEDLAAVHAHAASWEQMQLPAAFAVWLLFALMTAGRVTGWGRGVLGTAGWLLAWLPIRFLLATRVVDDLGWIGVHWHPLAVALSLAPAAILAERHRPMRSLRRLPWPVAPRGAARLAVAALGTALVVFALTAFPAGRRAPGRILVDDAHSDWEWTSIPFDRVTYGRQSTYSYRCLLDFLAHHYDVTSNADDDLGDALLDTADVLILKTPTRAYLESERDAVVRFVKRGGGLLLISDHTNLFGMTTYINPIGEPFGLEFDTDDTFVATSGQASHVVPPPLGAHPVVAHMPPLEFETSCSLRPRFALRPIIAGRGLASEQVDYGHINFFGNLTADPDERWGILLQAASTHYGLGRAVAFTDSTVWSNFSVYFEGKPELALGLMEFLNRRTARWASLMGLLAPLGLVIAAGAAAARSRGPRGARASHAALAFLGGTFAVAAGVIGGGLVATRANARGYPLPAPHDPMTTVAFEQGSSDFRLPTLIEQGVADPQRCFDAFFVATQRLHLFPKVAVDLREAVKGSQVVVVTRPTVSPDPGAIDVLYAWVQAGGRLLLLEPAGSAHLAANRILEPAGLRISAAFDAAGAREGPPVLGGLAIYGGTPVSLGPKDEGPLVSVAEVGTGRVVAVLGSDRFSLQGMGPVFNDPTPEQRANHDRVYDLFEKVVLPEGWTKECALVKRHLRGRTS
ncbi:MAG TPA: hypothetical protein VFQ07_11915, partial [Candidatus Polarisedimenticolia bacterium]|nr:hypothetical protein [Candidatus Polarisedimenticolia bacterium]